MQSVLETSNEKIAAWWAIIRRSTRCVRLDENYIVRGRGLFGLRSPLLIISSTFTHLRNTISNSCVRLIIEIRNGCVRLVMKVSNSCVRLSI